MRDEPTPAQIAEYAEKQVTMYKRRIESGSPNVRVGECTNYLRIWKSIVTKEGKELNEEEKNEVSDAYYAGDFDG